MCLYRTKKKKSTNILGVSMLSGTRWNPSRPVETRRNPVRLTRLNPSKHVQTCYVSSQPVWIIFYFSILGEGKGGGGGGEGNGQGTATAPGGSHHHHRRPVGRPSEVGGGQSPPPLLHQTKKNKIYKSNDISTLDNNILWIRKINAYKLKSVCAPKNVINSLIVNIIIYNLI